MTTNILRRLVQRDTGSQGIWAVAAVRGTFSEIRRRGAVETADAAYLSRHIIPEPPIPDRLAREQVADLPHPVACPECSDHGGYLRTHDGWDRLWCHGCGHIWEVPLAVLDECGLSTCLECRTAYIEEGAVYCEGCVEDREGDR